MAAGMIGSAALDNNFACSGCAIGTMVRSNTAPKSTLAVTVYPEHYTAYQGFRSMRRIHARRKKARALIPFLQVLRKNRENVVLTIFGR